ncbi:hypothetical protein [Hymenobacter volaticus]|uniref:Uncharacterized protein n=1 Tax=Hymenobacter volaticus TaxID=2932254 RepID=A0ABY4GGX7_9BACT|nr:hypothetical protein [Hymenobacter volaticus]UOQ69519.1 hypothetical protein MUN86_28170 [Hymenobacter volaticus]
MLLLLLMGLFLLVDVSGVLGRFANTSIGYRMGVVALVPLEVWVGYWMAGKLKPEPVRLVRGRA